MRALTDKTHTHNRPSVMPTAGLEPAIPADKQP